MPEPVLTSDGSLGPLETLEQRESISIGLLLTLERLTPAERAVFVLREAFDYGHREIAEILELSEANCRQLHHRARQRVGEPRARFRTSCEQWSRLVERFLAAAGAEGMVEASGLPWSILRATQFHDLIFLALEWLVRLPVLPVPAGFSFQPVDAGEVAAELVALAEGEPRGRVPDMGGPEVRGAGDLARTYLRARGRRRPILPLYLPGSVAAGFRRGGHLAPEGARGRRTWEDFLAATGPGSRSRRPA